MYNSYDHHSMTALETRSDEELCSLAAGGVRQAEEVLVARYNRMVRTCARPFFLAGAGRVLVRASGTEALIRVMVEAKTTAIAEEVAQRLVNFIKSLNF